MGERECVAIVMGVLTAEMMGRLADDFSLTTEQATDQVEDAMPELYATARRIYEYVGENMSYGMPH